MPTSLSRSATRRVGRQARQAIGGQQRRNAEAMLIGHLGSLDAVTGASSVGVFVAHDAEPDLQPLVDQLWGRRQRVALPVLNDSASDYRMRFVPWHRGEQLVAGRYGIPIPPEPQRASIEPDTVLVSLTAFDAAGQRMGRGGGFFDRYLADTAGQIIGVGFEAQRVSLVPVEPHDVPLPIMVTDLGVRFITRKPKERRGNLASSGKDGEPCE